MAALSQPEHLSALDGRLRALLDAEVAAGNVMGSTGAWLYAYVEILVAMRERFRVPVVAIPSGVIYEETQDHWIAGASVICEFRCEVPAPSGAEPGQKYWHVLRAFRD